MVVTSIASINISCPVIRNSTFCYKSQSLVIKKKYLDWLPSICLAALTRPYRYKVRGTQIYCSFCWTASHLFLVKFLTMVIFLSHEEQSSLASRYSLKNAVVSADSLTFLELEICIFMAARSHSLLFRQFHLTSHPDAQGTLRCQAEVHKGWMY